MPVDEETGEEIEFEDPRAQEEVEKSMLCAEIRAALEKLPEAWLAIIEWHYGQGLSEREIAQQLGRSKSWVHRRLSRALSALRAIVGEKVGEDEEGG